MPSKSAIISFVKSLASFRGDLSTITAPTFLLSSTSFLEYAAPWAEQPAFFIAPSQEPDPEKRALLVLKWYLTTVRPRLYGKSEKVLTKKPLNPFLGELFLGHWDDDDGSGITELVVEQVCHHPPIAATCVTNTTHGIRLQAYLRQASHFSGANVIAQHHGHAYLHLDKYNEDFLITFPGLTVKGLFTGTFYPEIERDAYIYSSSGFTSHIQHSSKGWFSGKKHSVNATVFSNTADKTPLYSITGTWMTELTIKDVRTDTVMETYGVRVANQKPLIVTEASDQDAWESRKAWHGTAAAITLGNGPAAVTRAKGKIENGQRKMREQEKANGISWVPRFFSTVPANEFLTKLVLEGKVDLQEDKTCGIWRYDTTKAQDAKSPYHAGITPEGPMGN